LSTTREKFVTVRDFGELVDLIYGKPVDRDNFNDAAHDMCYSKIGCCVRTRPEDVYDDTSWTDTSVSEVPAPEDTQLLLYETVSWDAPDSADTYIFDPLSLPATLSAEGIKRLSDAVYDRASQERSKRFREAIARAVADVEKAIAPLDGRLIVKFNPLRAELPDGDSVAPNVCDWGEMEYTDFQVVVPLTVINPSQQIRIPTTGHGNGVLAVSMKWSDRGQIVVDSGVFSVRIHFGDSSFRMTLDLTNVEAGWVVEDVCF